MKSLITRLLFGLIFLSIFAPLARADHPPIPAGSTGNAIQCIELLARDTSVTTEWTGLTGLAHTGAGVTPTCTYHRNTAADDTTITLADGTLGTWISGGIQEVDATTSTGKYSLCLPNAAVAVGADFVTVRCYGATDMEDSNVIVPLLQPNTFGYDGITSAEASGTPAAGRSRYTLVAGAIDAADNQFAYNAELALYDAAGLLEAVSCIIASSNTNDTVDLAEDVTGWTTVGDHYVIRANSACSALRPGTIGRTVLVNATGGVAPDWANVQAPTTAVALTGTTISVAQIVASVSGAVGSVTGNLGGTIGGFAAAALSDLFDTNSGTTYGAAVAGSVVKEIADNASGGGGGSGDFMITTGTAQSITTSPAKMRLAASAPYGNDVLRDHVAILILTSSGNTAAAGQVLCIKKNTASNDEVEFTRAYKEIPSGIVTYAAIPAPNCNTLAWPKDL